VDGVRVLLVSTYELGHQPVHVASPAAALRVAGHDVRCLDTSVQPWDRALIGWADAVAFSVPMHTAMRLALRGAAAVHRDRPDVPICFYGLYAAVSRDRVVGRLAHRVIAGEYEHALRAWVDGLAHGRRVDGPVIELGRSEFALPARDLLPPLEHYARLEVGGEQRLVGAVETTHGCRHTCRHCPLPTVYGGRIRAVDRDVVLDDVAQLVAAGAQHVTFADADFLNAPTHARRIVAGLHDRFPTLTFDLTVKVEHVLRHRDVWPEFGRAGCLFVVSALESTNDAILRRLDKGHTHAEAVEALHLLRTSGIEPRPTWLPFTPWTTPADVLDLLDFVAGHDLIGNVDPVQYAIRLLLPEGSLLLDHPDLTPWLGAYDADALSYAWRAVDPAADALQARLAALVEARLAEGAPHGAIFLEVYRLVAEAAGGVPAQIDPGSVEGRPRLTEPWFC
jgi:radical SAM superfamily enzyme YgiQ (UPF0313 family)